MKQVFKLKTSTKVLYALYHFFVGFILSYIVILWIPGLNKSPVLFRILLSILPAIFLLIQGIFSYRRFVQIDEENLYICTVKGKKVQALNKINKNSIEIFAFVHGKIYAIVDSKPIEILNISPSAYLVIACLIFVVPAIIVIPFLWQRAILSGAMLYKLNSFIGKADKEDRNRFMEFKKNEKIADILSWLFLMPAVIFGIFGLLYVLLNVVMLVLKALILILSQFN